MSFCGKTKHSLNLCFVMGASSAVTHWFVCFRLMLGYISASLHQTLKMIHIAPFMWTSGAPCWSLPEDLQCRVGTWWRPWLTCADNLLQGGVGRSFYSCLARHKQLLFPQRFGPLLNKERRVLQHHCTLFVVTGRGQQHPFTFVCQKYNTYKCFLDITDPRSFIA